MQWPEHPVYPSYGYVVRRRDLDTMVAEKAAARGATLRQGTEALRPILRDGCWSGRRRQGQGHGRGARAPRPLRRHRRRLELALRSGARHLRDKRLPAGHGHPRLLREPDARRPVDRVAPSTCATATATRCPGYGWIFPCGDGTINVGIGLLSTFRDCASINTSHLMRRVGGHRSRRTGASTPSAMLGEATGGRLPMAGSVGPKSGPTWIVVGDAAGSINPFNGEGIDYAYETGRMAADLIDEALATGSACRSLRYPDLLDDEYGLYFKVARVFAT